MDINDSICEEKKNDKKARASRHALFLQLLLLSKQPQNILYGIDYRDTFAGFEF